MKSYFRFSHPFLKSETEKGLKKKNLPTLFLLFSVLSLLIINSCSTDFNAAQTNKQTNKQTF